VAGTNRLRDLDHEPGYFHGSAPAAFFRRDEVERLGLRFDGRLNTFEDGHFCSAYLLGVSAPLVAFVSDAVYLYRRRDDGTSQLDGRWRNPARFTDVVEHGYLALLRDAAARSGRPPTWLQGMVIYELSYYLKVNDRPTAETVAYGETLEKFQGLFEETVGLLDDIGVDSYRATSLRPVWREILRHGYDAEPWHTPYAVVDKLDPDQNLMRVCYRYRGDAPSEECYVHGTQVDPVHHKIRDVRFFDRTVLHERIVWLRFGTVRVVLDGRDVDVRTSDPKPPDHTLTGAVIKRELDPAAAAATKPADAPSAADRRVLRLARSRPVRRQFGDAWVLIDRVFNADDSAEHLFRYLRRHRPEVNAWFVIERGTPDHRRLVRDGYGRRVVAHGSLRWKLLMLNCRQLISSHADDAVVRPRAIRMLAEPRWRTTFLQHGVTKDDLSTWLNRKDFDLFVTSTPAELESVVGDHTTYRYTTREVKLTGLPRFDRIREEGDRVPPDQRDLILVAPTWRQWLSISEPVVSGRHRVSTEAFAGSTYAQEWTAFLNSAELRQLAERTGLTVALLLHPNFQQTAQLDTQAHVVPLRFEGQNVQEIFARARVLVTDYSSMFFNAAYIERPVVYFQFDRDRLELGGHLGRKGYFDYERDGFGPVTLTVDEAVAAVSKTVESGPEPDPIYLDRIRASFPERDGRCCERVADMIAASTRHVAPGGRPAPAADGLVRRAREVADGAARRLRRS
jgi:CDP-glycerol glycerophosphotransferase (TagB/SpsB family)